MVDQAGLAQNPVVINPSTDTAASVKKKTRRTGTLLIHSSQMVRKNPTDELTLPEPKSVVFQSEIDPVDIDVVSIISTSSSLREKLTGFDSESNS